MTVAVAKSDLLILGPLATATVNTASSAFHDFTSLEAKITAASAYAVSVGAKRLYIPDCFSNYVPGQVTIDPSLTVVTEAQLTGAAVLDAPVALVSGAAPALDASAGSYFTLSITANIAVVIGVPTNNPGTGSKSITIALRNSSGGALTTPPTFNTGAGGFKFAAVASPANGAQILYRFQWDPVQSFWYEVGQPTPSL